MMLARFAVKTVEENESHSNNSIWNFPELFPEASFETVIGIAIFDSLIYSLTFSVPTHFK